MYSYVMYNCTCCKHLLWWSSRSCNGLSWVTVHNVTSPNSSGLHNYLVSLYWTAATTTSTGYGDVRAANNTERLFAVAAMLTGLVLYGYVVTLVAATIANILLPR